ncbi:hypothetical protein AS850_09980 [Frondihabitans sp. 762G35]|uniref:DUF4350 domain-containing protein n=1 Tax=Frondihabitans sp. 762G35 TaxID=1446794 RepID=UPI000D20EF5B|nr:DUF4350 domain-containing protein [Frondihabitans sp. 762G35]ARC57403.1 hypothetical protein AS850_09980 [Frondihabitans sp. 762G35]
MTALDTRPRRPVREPSGVAAVLLRGRFWIAVVVAALLAAVAALVITGTGAAAGALDPASTQPGGARAVVSVLRQQGIDVVTTSTLSETRRAIAADPANTTVVAYDPGPYLDASQWTTLARASGRLVVVEPEQAALDRIAPGVSRSEAPLAGDLAPRCDLPALAASRSILATGVRYTASAAADAVTCLPASSGGGYGLVQVERSGGTTTVVGASAALTNQYVADRDDAAFALRLLGATPRVVWYLPSVADLPETSGTLASLTPGWVTPSILLLGAAAVAGAVWRGRRLGPLVVENLPVVVRSTETMEGRARLYERSSARSHALDQVRIGTIARLASLVGLSGGSGVDEVVGRVAEVLAVDPAEVRGVLVDTVPVDDSHLVALSDSLRDLENATARAVRLG